MCLAPIRLPADEVKHVHLVMASDGSLDVESFNESISVVCNVDIRLMFNISFTAHTGSQGVALRKVNAFNQMLLAKYLVVIGWCFSISQSWTSNLL